MKIEDIIKRVKEIIEATTDDIRFASDHNLVCQTKGHQKALVLLALLEERDNIK